MLLKMRTIQVMYNNNNFESAVDCVLMQVKLLMILCELVLIWVSENLIDIHLVCIRNYYNLFL